MIESLRDKAIRGVAAGLAHSMFLRETTGDVYTCGWNSQGQLGLGKATSHTSSVTQIAEFSGVLHLACGGGHTIFITRDTPRDVHATGSNSCG